MKKRVIFCLSIVLALSIFLTGCCNHSWIEATCTEPRTCSACGETEGEANGHTFREATCEAPKTCEVCGYTEGEKLGHQYMAATCDEPETCKVCGATKGSALGHTTGWGICSRCGKEQLDLITTATNIIELNTDGMNLLTEANQYLTTAIYMSDGFEYIYAAYAKQLFALEKYLEALYECGNFVEFAEAKKELQAICDGLMPLMDWKPSSNSDLYKLDEIDDTISPHIMELNFILDEWLKFGKQY